LYEEFKQAARETLERLAPYVEIAGRIRRNMVYVKEAMERKFDLEPAPRDSFRRYAKVGRTMSFPEWFAFAFGKREEMTLRSFTVTGYDITLRFDEETFRLYIDDCASLDDIVVLSMLGDREWQRIVNSVRSAPEAVRRNVERLHGVCGVVREVLEQPARPADYRGLLRRYTINGKLLSALDDIIELVFSNGDWADLTVGEEGGNGFARSLRNVRIVLLNGECMDSMQAETEVCRDLRLPQEIERVDGVKYKWLRKVRIRGTGLELSVLYDSRFFYNSTMTINIVDCWGATSVWNLILAHYMLTDWEWEWIYGRMLRFLELSEIAREKFRDAAATLSLLS
jgi:hypothetical protein